VAMGWLMNLTLQRENLLSSDISNKYMYMYPTDYLLSDGYGDIQS